LAHPLGKAQWFMDAMMGPKVYEIRATLVPLSVPVEVEIALLQDSMEAFKPSNDIPRGT
jgi:hypothetical protein